MGSLTIGLCYASLFCADVSFLPLVPTLGRDATLSLYALMAFTVAIFALFRLPETKGKTLQDLQKSLHFQARQVLCHYIHSIDLKWSIHFYSNGRVGDIAH